MSRKKTKDKAVELGMASHEYICDLERLADAVEKMYLENPILCDKYELDEKLKAVGKLLQPMIQGFPYGKSKTKPNLDTIERLLK